MTPCPKCSSTRLVSRPALVGKGLVHECTACGYWWVDQLKLPPGVARNFDKAIDVLLRGKGGSR